MPRLLLRHDFFLIMLSEIYTASKIVILHPRIRYITGGVTCSLKK